MDKKIGNEIIAEFLGYQKANYVEDKDELEFDTDWNDLMHVVEKCFATNIEGLSHNEIELALICFTENRKERVWLACIHFIQNIIK